MVMVDVVSELLTGGLMAQVGRFVIYTTTLLATTD